MLFEADWGPKPNVKSAKCLVKNAKEKRRGNSKSRAFHPPSTSKLSTCPGSHSAKISNGRQHTSQSVVNRWLATLVSMTSSNRCPQKGHKIGSETSILLYLTWGKRCINI